jgi:hypothetical protein
VDYAFALCLSREPSRAERQIAAESFRNLKTILDRDSKAVRELVPVDTADPLETAAWIGFSRALLNADEFVTRE